MNIAWISETGKREDNQDSCILYSQDQKPAVVVIADGMGGCAGGSTASRLAVECVYRCCQDENAFDIFWLRSCVQEANTLIRNAAEANPSLGGMGTTLVICVLRTDGILVANVGDSRLYRFNGVTLKQVTVDHSYVQELVNWHVITREEARVHPKRNIILRAVGTDPDVEPDIFSETWSAGETLLLSTDGLHDSMTDEQIGAVLSAEDPIQQRLERLVETALAQGSTDNISAIICINSGEAAL